MLAIELFIAMEFPLFQPVNSELGSALVVYIGAHSDDIEIGMSGALYKRFLGRQPILWIVVTDGGADEREYYYDSDPSREWIAQDAVLNADWVAPNGKLFKRDFYSEDLSRKRCGIEGSYLHEYDALKAYDWRTRVEKKIDASLIGLLQMNYPDPVNLSREILYPDSGLWMSESVYTERLATDLASEISKAVTSNGLRRDILYINSHAPEEVAENAAEHPSGDHRIVGNAVRKAIDYLQADYGFGTVIADWYTIYNPIRPRQNTPYERKQENISEYKSQKSDLCKAMWETAYFDHYDVMDRSKQVPNPEGYWIDFPGDPGDYEYMVEWKYESPWIYRSYITSSLLFAVSFGLISGMILLLLSTHSRQRRSSARSGTVRPLR